MMKRVILGMGIRNDVILIHARKKKQEPNNTWVPAFLYKLILV